MTSNTEKLQKFLEKNSMMDAQSCEFFIRLHWVDFSGVLRARFLPIDRCFRIASGDEEYLVPQVSMIIPVSTAPKCFPIGSDLETWVLRPDWSSLRVCGFRSNHASVMCFMEHKEASETFNQCPRMLLSRAIARLEKSYGSRLLAGFEVECMLLNAESQPLRQLDRLNSYQTTAGLRDTNLDIVEEVIKDFQRSSIKIHHFHTETHDQIEFALSPEPLMDAIDSLILAQETIRTVFVQHHIKATMAPKPLLKGPTNGIHLHMSVDKLAPPQTDRFLAGVLTHTSSLCAFGMPNVDGYTRVGKDAAGAWVGFGTENRDLPVRKINDQHWEFRMLDATANPYLFSAAVLLAGLDGLARQLPLTWQDTRVFPHSMTRTERLACHLYQEMPNSLQQSLDSLREDTELKKLIPMELIDSYISVKAMEVEVFEQMPEEQRRDRFLDYF